MEVPATGNETETAIQKPVVEQASLPVQTVPSEGPFVNDGEDDDGDEFGDFGDFQTFADSSERSTGHRMTTVITDHSISAPMNTSPAIPANTTSSQHQSVVPQYPNIFELDMFAIQEFVTNFDEQLMHMFVDTHSS